MGCSMSGGCAFFNQEQMEQLSGLAALYRSRYCEGDHAQCARHKVLEAYGEGAIPRDMRPNDHDRASQMLDGVVV
jgi:hypothetical protein